MKKKYPFKSFNNYVLRTPVLSFSFFKKVTSKVNVSDEEILTLFEFELIREAIFLASPSLYKEVIKWSKGELRNVKKQERIKITILKYFSRMCSRCTPYGLFAGCSVGEFADFTDIELNKFKFNKRYTTLDMSFLVSLSQSLIKHEEIKKRIKFYPNTSLNYIWDEIRYLEYKYQDANRQYQTVSLDKTNYLDDILKITEKGLLFDDLVNYLNVDYDVDSETATEFINELIENQVLVSELEPSVTGVDFLKQVKETLKQIKGDDYIINIIDEVELLLSDLDNSYTNNVSKYFQISRLLERFDLESDINYLFKCETFVNLKRNFLDKNLLNDISRGITLFNKITSKEIDNRLIRFKNEFYERYGDKEIPLLLALDDEVGVGYKKDIMNGDLNPLVDDLSQDALVSSNSKINFNWTKINTFFQEKINKAYKDNLYKITIDDNDFSDMEADWEDIPSTFSCMIELVQEEGDSKIVMSSAGGASGASILGRFCNGNELIYNHVSNIIKEENKVNINGVVSEIVHLPEDRIGNVLTRPDFRDYEIPYLAKSVKPIERQIKLKDLMISIRNDEVFLRSKKLDKQVIPYLMNAHNFSMPTSLPIYHFLCDMQRQNKRLKIGFSYGPLLNQYEFLPRLEYNNLILHEATWKLSYTHVSELIDNIDNETQLLFYINKFVEKFKLPQFILLIEGDNKLVINLKNLTSVKMFLKEIKNKTYFTISEFLYGDDGVVKRKDSYFTNQIILSFYKKK